MTAEPFSVLLPVYRGDHADHFERAIASATVEQHRRPDELVVVRDGPVGRKLQGVLDALAAGGPDSPAGDVPVTLVPLERNLGLALALEEGLAGCRHEIVARLDADDICLPQRFELQVPHLEAGMDLVGSAITEFADDEQVPGMVRRMPTSQDAIAAMARFRDPFNHPSVVYRRSAVAAVGGYRDLRLMEDYLLFARMIANGAKVANLPDSLVMYRVGAGAYKRRGGWALLCSELGLQRALRRSGFTTRFQAVRNVVVRGGYRLMPEWLRRHAYRRMVRASRKRSALT